MSSSSTFQDLVPGDDHWVSLAIGLLVMVLCGFFLNIQLFWLLAIGALVSGIVDMAIKVVPPNPENYDEDQYILWDAAFGDGNTSAEAYQEKLREREKNKNIQKTNEEHPDALDSLRDRYVRGELTEEQFERKLDHLLETEIPENAEEWRTNEREPIKEN